MGTVRCIFGWCVLTACLGLTARQGAAQGLKEGIIQAILVHDTAAVPAEILRRAEAEATRIFFLANVRISWLHCSAPVPEAGERRPCPPCPAGTIILRIVPTTAGLLGVSALGYAIMPGQAPGYATVSYRRVQLCVARQTTSAAGLHHVLGHAMAHELGHILLGTSTHAVAGLMKPEWDARSLDCASKGGLNFSRDEWRRLQDGVAERHR